MNSQKNRLLVLALAVILCRSVSTGATENSSGQAVFASAPSGAPTTVKTVALVVMPDNSLEAAAVRDIVSAQLLQAGIKVVSDETVMRTRDAMFRKIASEQEPGAADPPADSKDPAGPGKASQTQPVKKPDQPLPDGLAVARQAGAGCLIKLIVMAQPVQQNIYDKENKRILEVRTESRVSLVTANIVDLDGNTIKVGSVSYSEPVSAATAASDLGKVLVQQLAKK